MCGNLSVLRPLWACVQLNVFLPSNEMSLDEGKAPKTPLAISSPIFRVFSGFHQKPESIVSCVVCLSLYPQNLYQLTLKHIHHHHHYDNFTSLCEAVVHHYFHLV